MKILNLPGYAAIVIAVAFLFGSCKKDVVSTTTNQTKNLSGNATNEKMVLVPGAGWIPANQLHIIELEIVWYAVMGIF